MNQDFLGPNPDGDVSHPAERRKQLIAWKAELALRQHRSGEALKLVLKFKQNEHVRNKVRVAGAFQRLTGPSFPRDLLQLVVEAVANSSSSFSFSTSQSRLLELVSKQVFTRWPEDLGSDARSLLLGEAVDAILRYGFFKIPAELTATRTIPIPQAVHGKEHLLRHLSLDPYTMPRGDSFDRELESGVESMALLKLQFPCLEACVILLQYHQTITMRMRLRVTSQMQSIEDISKIIVTCGGQDCPIRSV